MAFWIFMLIMSIFTPVIILGVGLSYSKNPPTKINKWCGYRTNMSMKNTDTWVFAQNYFGLIWKKMGQISILLSPIPMLFVIGKSEDIVGVVSSTIIFIQLAFIFLSIYFVEKKLKKVFNKDGNRL